MRPRPGNRPGFFVGRRIALSPQRAQRFTENSRSNQGGEQPPILIPGEAPMDFLCVLCALCGETGCVFPRPGQRPGLQPIRNPSRAKARRVSFVVQPSGWSLGRRARARRALGHVERRRSRSRNISACCRRRTAGIRPRSLDRLGMTAERQPRIFFVLFAFSVVKTAVGVQGSTPFPGTKKGTPRGVPFRKANV